MTTTQTATQRLQRAIRRHEQIVKVQTLLDALRAGVLEELRAAREAAFEKEANMLEREPAR